MCEIKEQAMKKILVLMMAILISVPAFAQMRTVFSGRITNGGYGSLVVKFSDIDGETGIWVGGKGGWIINHSLVIGGAGYGLASDVKEVYYTVEHKTQKLGCGYGGFIMEYIYKPMQMIHITGGILIGAGGVGYRYIDDDGDNTYGNSDADAFFAMEPSVGLELNIARNIRAEVGGSYLYTSGAELSSGNTPYVDDKDLTGPMGYLARTFGSF
jgi:hypothetical protein